jgi:hypothetical protein
LGLKISKRHKNKKTVCGVQSTGQTKKTRKFENIENIYLRGRVAIFFAFKP